MNKKTNASNNMAINIIWNTFGSIFYSACQWLITVLVVHLDSYGAAGFLSLAMTTSSSFSAISLFSMRNFQVSDVTGKYKTKQYVGSRVLTCIIAFITCAVYSSICNSVFQALCIDAFMLIRVAEAFTDVLHGENQKFSRYDYIGQSYILRGLFTVVTFILGLKFTGNLMITLFVIAAINLCIAVIFDFVRTSTLEEIKFEIISSDVLNLLKECLPIVVFSFLLSTENLIPKQLLESINGNEQLGIYSSIASPTLVVQVFASVCFNPFLPGMSKLYVDGNVDAFKKQLHKVYLAFIGLCFVVTIGAMLIGRIGLRIIFGVDILEYYYLFMPIVWCTILTAIIWIMSAIIVAIRQIKIMLLGMLVDFLFMLVSVNYFICSYGMNGVSLVQITSYAIYILFMILICEYTVKKRRKELCMKD